MSTKFIINGLDIDGVVEVSGWIKNGINKVAIFYAEKFGENLTNVKNDKEKKSELSTSQIRNFFGEVKRIQMRKPFPFKDFLLLKPRLAYSTERNGTVGSKEFHRVMDKAMDAVINAENDKQEEYFENFISFLEAVLAYHKTFGGK